VPLISAAMCPHPIRLIPDIFGETGAQWQRLRVACLEAVRQLRIPIATGPESTVDDPADLVVIVGGDDATRDFDTARAYGSLLSNGVFWEFGWPSDHLERQPLPLSLTLGNWLMSKSRPGDTGVVVADVLFQAIAFDATSQECAELGRDLAGRAERVAMLVMGEGSTGLTAAAWEHGGDDARRYDQTVVRALEDADADAIGRLKFWLPATGRAAWQVLAGAAAGHRFDGQLHAGGTPDDMGYFVASWTRQSR
jgi:hypothetical protein